MRINFVHLPPLNAKKANTLQVLNTISALKNLQIDVEFYGRSGRSSNWKFDVASNDTDFKKIIEIGQFVKTPNILHHLENKNFLNNKFAKRIVFIYESLYTTLGIIRKCRKGAGTNEIYYSRSPILLFGLYLAMGIFGNGKPQLAIELHDVPKNLISKIVFNYVCSKSKSIFGVTKAFKKHIPEHCLTKFCFLPDGVAEKYINEHDNFTIDDNDVINIGYFGRFTTYNIDKGVNDLLEAFQNCNFKRRTHLYLAGATKAEKEFYSKKLIDSAQTPSVDILEFMPNKQSMALAAKCHILVMPHPANKFFSEFVSPLKLFEYMALGKIIINARLPAIEEILPRDQLSVSYDNKDKGSLTRTLEKTVNEIEKYAVRANKAQLSVKNFTWAKRAKTIANVIFEAQ